jgi:hypothetical protein
MQDPTGFIEGLTARVQGPVNLRLLLQPAMALFFAIRDGRRDARAGNVPFFWGLFTHPERRRDMLHSGWKSVGKVFLIAITLDLVFQYLEFDTIRVSGALAAGVTLALVPYIVFRGPANRLTRQGTSRPDDAPKDAHS